MILESLSAGQLRIIDSDRETRRLIRRLDRIADEEIGELISKIPQPTQDRLRAAYAALYFWASDECDLCYGKSYRGVDKCGCRGGRISKDATICRLMKKIYDLESK